MLMLDENKNIRVMDNDQIELEI